MPTKSGRKTYGSNPLQERRSDAGRLLSDKTHVRARFAIARLAGPAWVAGFRSPGSQETLLVAGLGIRVQRPSRPRGVTAVFIVADQAEQVLELGARRGGLGGRRIIRSRVTRGLRLQNGRRWDDFEVAAAQSRDQARPLVTDFVGRVDALLATLFSTTDGRARMRRICRVLGRQPRRQVRFDRDNEQSGAKGLSEGTRRRSAKPVTSSQERRRPQLN